MKWSAKIVLGLALLLTACGGRAGSGGSWSQPIYPKICPEGCDRMKDPNCGPPVCDLLTEETAQQIEDRNEAGARIEGW